MVPVPMPALLEERIRLVLEMEEAWKEQLKSMKPEEDIAFEDTLGGLWFNGFDTVIQLPRAPELGLTRSSFTVEAMIRIDEFKGVDETILGTDQTGYCKGLHLVIRHRRPYMGFYANDLQRRAYPVAGSVHRAGDSTVGIARTQHQVGETEWITRLDFGLPRGHALVLAQFVESLTISLVVL